MRLVDRLMSGDVGALARAISIVEEDTPDAPALLRGIFSRTGNATVIGLTGSPGAGKSSLVDRMITAYRGAGSKVGVIAVDPSSAFSGGALLGDRVRMQTHSTDPGVFIRSMATRGQLGGLARATNDAIDLFDAAGYDPILLETVGVGQDEVDVVKTADVVCVVLVPGMGDDIQAIKAGILEIADLFVINKADHPGADRLQADLDYMLSLVTQRDRPAPEILRTVAIREEGITELTGGIGHYLDSTEAEQKSDRRRERAEARLIATLKDRLLQKVLEETLGGASFHALVDRIADRSEDPYTAVERVLARLEVRR